MQEAYTQIHIKHIIIVAFGGRLKGKQIREEEIISKLFKKSVSHKRNPTQTTMTMHLEMRSRII